MKSAALSKRHIGQLAYFLGDLEPSNDPKFLPDFFDDTSRPRVLELIMVGSHDTVGYHSVVRQQKGMPSVGWWNVIADRQPSSGLPRPY